MSRTSGCLEVLLECIFHFSEGHLHVSANTRCDYMDGQPLARRVALNDTTKLIFNISVFM